MDSEPPGRTRPVEVRLRGAFSDRMTFRRSGTWGGEIRREFEPQPGEIVALEHWSSSAIVTTTEIVDSISSL
jgi:hypothetical protein